MKNWTSTQVSVEGHADSRGSSEYNLALGIATCRRREGTTWSAWALPANRVTVISKGKEQPVCTETTESCWQQNRRGHFIVTAK